MTKISFIIPCYFNEGNIPLTVDRLIKNESLFDLDLKFEYIMVDDGSKDNTFQELVNFYKRYPAKVKIVKLTRNFGVHNAILAGLNHSTGHCHIVISADLQDPPELIPKMYRFWKQGFKIVVANRVGREEPCGQKFLSNAYHYLMRNFIFKNAPVGGFDLCLLDEEVRTALIKMNEKNTPLTYSLFWLGYEYINIPYVRQRRMIGHSQWTFSKKVKLFIDSIVSFSYIPIRIISLLGILMGLIAIGYGIFIIYARLTGLFLVNGWAYLIVFLLLSSSFQLLALGIIGEYVWRGFDASRNRPNYIIQTVLDIKEKVPP